MQVEYLELNKQTIYFYSVIISFVQKVFKKEIFLIKNKCQLVYDCIYLGKIRP